MLLDSALNQGLFAFNPDMMFENLVKDYSNAEKIYGESFLRFASGYDNNTIKKNIRFPEFQRELKKNLKQTEQELKDEDLIDKEGSITDKGFSLASIVLYMQELDDLRAKGFGDKKTKKAMVYGDKENTRNFRPHDRYKDIAIKSSVRKAIRRRHSGLSNEDLQVFERDNKGKIFIVYGLDASGSMKGKKIEICKKAGIALAYKAINEKDKVEKAFRSLKSILGLKPIKHWLEERVKSHVFICYLSYLLLSLLEAKLKKTKISAIAGLDKLSTAYKVCLRNKKIKNDFEKIVTLSKEQEKIMLLLPILNDY